MKCKIRTRRDDIALLIQNGLYKVADLALMFGVSTVTIQSDVNAWNCYTYNLKGYLIKAGTEND
jgi:hypothetical protein